jgi:chromosome partitioning protein
MHAIIFASRKGGTGKSTLAAHLAAQCAKPRRRTLLVDSDPQGSLSLWHGLRDAEDLLLRPATRGVGEILKNAARDGVEWAFVDTPPNTSAAVEDAIRAATLVVIPARPSLFDMAAVEDTIALCRKLKKPFAVVMNGAPARRGSSDPAVVRGIRESLGERGVPVWSGQITHRAALSASLDQGQGVRESDEGSAAADEMAALWLAIQKSVKAIAQAHANARGMHKAA